MTSYGLQSEYAAHGPCPDCGERAIRPRASLNPLKDNPEGHICDACETTFSDFNDMRYDDPEVTEVWMNDPSAFEEREPGRIGSALMRVGSFLNDTYKEAKEQEEPDRELTAGEKSRSYLADACFVMGLMFSVTIIGIPFGLVFFVMAALVAPNFEDE